MFSDQLLHKQQLMCIVMQEHSIFSHSHFRITLGELPLVDRYLIELLVDHRILRHKSVVHDAMTVGKDFFLSNPAETLWLLAMMVTLSWSTVMCFGNHTENSFFTHGRKFR
jgi:hypothetical protein